MWQILWMLSWLPDWFFHTVLIVSVLAVISSYILKRIPWINTYSTPLRVIGIVVLLATVWVEGGRNVEEVWKAKVAEAQEKVDKAEAAAALVNRGLEKKTKEKIKVVKEVQVVIQERIKEVEKRIDAECKVDPEAITILNDAAKNQKGKSK